MYSLPITVSREEGDTSKMVSLVSRIALTDRQLSKLTGVVIFFLFLSMRSVSQDAGFDFTIISK